MESRDFVYLQEAYQEIYQLDEEVEIATEYFYEMGFNEDDVISIIEELGVDGFNDYVCGILEEYGITNISEAAKWQDRLARGVLNAMERDRKAREQFGKTRVGKALSNIGSKAAAGLTAIGDVGEKGFRAGVGAGVRAAERATRPSGTSKNADENKRTSPSRVTSKHRSHGRVKSDPRPIGSPSSGPKKDTDKKATGSTSSSLGTIKGNVGAGRREAASSGGVSSRGGAMGRGPSSTGRALPPVGTTKAGKPLTLSQRKMQTDAQNKRLKKRLGLPEEFEAWVEGLWEEGYDLSDYTWEGLYEAYVDLYEEERSILDTEARRINQARAAWSSARKAAEAGDDTERKRQVKRYNAMSFPETRRQELKLHKELGIRKEEVEAYNTIADYLLDEGYAHDLDSADAIIASMSEEWIVDILEARVSYSTKKAAAGKDIGKPGKQFAKIARSAGKRYGSKERGEKVAGAILAKLRKG